MNAHNRHSLKHSFVAVRVDKWPSRVNLVWVLINSFFWSIIVQVVQLVLVGRDAGAVYVAADCRASGS
jgi:hypothetical protein